MTEELESNGLAAPGNPAAQLACVSRQAIYDGASNVIAYELLYRQAESAPTALIGEDVQATLHVIVQMAIEIGLERLSDKLPVHINYPSELLEAATLPPFPPSNIVIEVLETVRGSPKLLAGIEAFRAAGYRIALEDFRPDVSDGALLPMADIVKLDISCLSHQELADHVRTLRNSRVTLIAERVENASDFERCRALGFDAYQGYYLHHPQTFASRPVPSNRLTALRLVAYLQNREPKVDEVANLISKDLSLPYQVLRCINSSYYGLPRKVASIQQATVMLGFERIRQLCAIIALRRVEERPQSLFIDAMTRARMCEQLGPLRGRAGDAASLFLVGLFSLLDAITGIEMSELLKDLPLSNPVVEALLTKQGSLGPILREVIDYERGAWTTAEYRGLSHARMRDVYFEAIRWTRRANALSSI